MLMDDQNIQTELPVTKSPNIEKKTTYTKIKYMSEYYYTMRYENQ